jgi:hypothetical protein
MVVAVSVCRGTSMFHVLTMWFLVGPAVEPLPRELAPFFRPPAEFADDFGHYRRHRRPRRKTGRSGGRRS